MDAVKERWNEVEEDLLGYLLDNIDCTEELIVSSADTDLSIWDIRYSHSEEVRKLKNWLEKRFEFLDTAINNYPSFPHK